MIYAVLAFWLPRSKAQKNLLVTNSVMFLIFTALQRIIINACGALLVVLLMTYIVPNDFWINFFLLVVLLFGIFALGFSNVWRTLFIELFVLSFTHLLGQYQNIIAYDRIFLTFLGCLLAISSNLVVYRFSPAKS